MINMENNLYMKKPIQVVAVKFEYTEECLKNLKEWMQDSFGSYSKARTPNAKGQLEVKTLEDGTANHTVTHIATEGDYILKGFVNEFWVVNPEIFESTYEKIK